ncbi:hypothetical protein WOLCODRAFT_152801 [Wolfiporia cocos MD-104 SS10]|uniref:Uncharacterized protein n=1 Tax=Wolfiporia cocos (strain MD-104) TaxID=742152 RepID=A0A2H3K2X6_WOLCO|nr:hypothetical protein WOLCODRAFT_152801 [Wolfiporia cocos MD-104 SS10]
MQCFDPDLPTRLINLLPESYRRISYEEKYNWVDPPAGFFMKGGYLTILSPDRSSPTWVQVPPSSIDLWDQTRTTFKRFGMVADIMTPTLTIHQADGKQQTNTPSTGGTMGMAGTAMGGSTLPGSGRMSQALLAEQTPLEQDLLEEEAFLEGEVPWAGEAPQAGEVPWAVEEIQRAAWEAIQEEAPQAEEDHQAGAQQAEEFLQDGGCKPPRETA